MGRRNNNLDGDCDRNTLNARVHPPYGIQSRADCPACSSGPPMAFSGVTTKFGTTADGPFTATPPNPPTNYDYVQVAASVDLPMYPIRPLSGPTAPAAGARRMYRIRLLAGPPPTAGVAGRGAFPAPPWGIFPFSPFTRAPPPAN